MGKFRTFILLIFISFSGSLHSAPTEKEMALLKKGELVLYKNRRKGKKWPDIEIYLYAKTTPLEAVATFSAYDHQKNYLPNLLRSEVTKVVSPTVLETSYEMELPWPLKNSHYINEHTLEKLGENSYKVSWRTIKNDTVDEITGHAIFTKQDEGTLFYYKNFVSPKSFFAGLFEDQMLKDVRKSMRITRDEIEKIKSHHPKKLKEYIERIHKALDGKKPY